MSLNNNASYGLNRCQVETWYREAFFREEMDFDKESEREAVILFTCKANNAENKSSANLHDGMFSKYTTILSACTYGESKIQAEDYIINSFTNETINSPIRYRHPKDKIHLAVNCLKTEEIVFGHHGMGDSIQISSNSHPSIIRSLLVTLTHLKNQPRHHDWGSFSAILRSPSRVK